MPLVNWLASGKILDKEDFFGQVSCAASSTGNIVIAAKRLKIGYEPLLVGYRQAWDGTINNAITMHLNVDNIPFYPYDNTQVQLGAPEQDVYIPNPIWLPQNCLVGVTADVDSTATGTGYAVGRLIIAYFKPGNLP